MGYWEKHIQYANKRGRIKLILLSVLFFVFAAFVYADAYGMHWYIPGNITDTTLWFNYTVADFSGNKPEAICFGLKNSSICVSTNTTSLNMDNKPIFNVSDMYVNNMTCLNGTCITSWDDVNQSGASMTSTSYTGASCNGSSGEIKRNLTFGSTPTQVMVDGMVYVPTVWYSVSGGIITFKNQIWDDQRIVVYS